jgi:hypothetical protein
MATATVEPTLMRKPPTTSEGTAANSTATTLVQKIAEACNAVGGIEKRGRNQKQNYEYVMAADVAAAFRHELFERSVILLQDEDSVEFHDYETNSGNTMQECRLRIKFTLKDDSGEISSFAYGVGRDTFDKAIYKAKTGATKYFLRGLGLIPDRADDPEDAKTEQEVKSQRPAERHAPAPEPITPTYPPRQPLREEKPSVPVGSILPFQKNAFLNAAKKSNKTNDQVVAYLGSLGYESLEEMPKKDFPQALKWAMEG